MGIRAPVWGRENPNSKRLVPTESLIAVPRTCCNFPATGIAALVEKVGVGIAGSFLKLGLTLKSHALITVGSSRRCGRSFGFSFCFGRGQDRGRISLSRRLRDSVFIEIEGGGVGSFEEEKEEAAAVVVAGAHRGRRVSRDGKVFFLGWKFPP